MTTLYKKDSSGKTRFLEIKTEGSDLIQTSGVLGTNSPTEHRKTCQSKNIGRSNETKSEEQAILEMESKIREKLTEGYFRTIEECKTEVVILPMLAKSYNDEEKKIDWNNCFIQPKLDGQRVLAIKKNGKVNLMSRDGKEIITLEHIIKQLENPSIPDNIYDGEAYNLELGSFQEQMKAIKKYRKGITEQIQFNCYDIISDLPFYKRYEILRNILA